MYPNYPAGVNDQVISEEWGESEEETPSWDRLEDLE